MNHAERTEPLAFFDDLDDPGAVSVVRGAGADRMDVLLLRNGGTVSAFLNACPHQGTPLETFDGRFFTSDKQRLLCSTHGAEFRLEDGHCLHGPCQGRALTPVPISVDDTGAIRLIDADPDT